MRGLCDFTLAYDDYPRLREFMWHACQTEGGTKQTYVLSRFVLRKDTPGVFVECGVAAGAQLASMAQAMRREAKVRKIHAFDSFKGIPHAGPKDTQQPGLADFLMSREAPLNERLTSSGVSCCPLEGVKHNWDLWGFKEVEIEWHEGWFQDTLPKNKVELIAFLRLDGDLYESTQCCLQWLYDKVSPGGIVYVDDYGLGGCCAAVNEFLADRKLNPELFCDQEGNAGAIYWIKADAEQ